MIRPTFQRVKDGIAIRLGRFGYVRYGDRSLLDLPFVSFARVGDRWGLRIWRLWVSPYAERVEG